MLPSVAVMLMLLSFTYGENPAIQVILTNKGLQQGVHEATGLIQEKLEKLTLPDISGRINILIGHVDYTLTGVTITKCDLPEPTVKFFQEHTGFTVSILGLSVALTGDWSTHFGLIHDGGSFDMAIFNLALTSAVELGRDAKGHLSVTSISCDAQIGDLGVKFYGGASKIFQPFVDYFKGHFIKRIKDRICPALEENIDMLESHLQAMNVSFDVDQVLTLDVPLTGSPIVTAASMKLGFKGEFYSIKTHEEPPFVAHPFILPEQPDYMLSVGLSEFTLNSALYGYFSAGELQVHINESMVPPKSPVHLNTSSMGMFVPQLPKQFPGLLMDLQVYARQAPTFSLQPGVVKLGVQAAVNAFAIEPNGTQIPLFILNVDTQFSGKVWTADEKLKGSVMMDNFTLTLVSSKVGTVRIDALENTVWAGMKLMILPEVNEKLGNGIILLRTKHAQLINSVLKMEKEFIAFFSDAQILQTEENFNK
ncbi:bactericidal permeability-increasing protein [Melanotaenia boesemani]|uniref:bactericidal permeability-increasing protein n=1 Tax=Melanotaenia boesemani TaxID=1250792 RepID=UPI001C054A52|nr:bactericidal permeability-increasing protein [Melanotaenia boesemani]